MHTWTNMSKLTTAVKLCLIFACSLVAIGKGWLIVASTEVSIREGFKKCWLINVPNGFDADEMQMRPLVFLHSFGTRLVVKLIFWLTFQPALYVYYLFKKLATGALHDSIEQINQTSIERCVLATEGGALRVKDGWPRRFPWVLEQGDRDDEKLSTAGKLEEHNAPICSKIYAFKLIACRHLRHLVLSLISWKGMMHIPKTHFITKSRNPQKVYIYWSKTPMNTK